MNSRGFSLVELLISSAITLVLLTAVGAAIGQILHLQAVHSGRAGESRTIAMLCERLGEEARSSTALFIPSVDVTGAPNVGAAAHEVDFFRRLSEGGDTFVAYRFDATSGSIARDEYVFSSGIKTITNEDIAAHDIAAFSLARVPISSFGAIAGASRPIDVSIMYGQPEWVGGNDIIVASVTPRGGIDNQTVTIHLATRAAPTALAVLAPKPVPSAPLGSDSFPFIVLHPGFPRWSPGPVHSGSEGPPPAHWIAASGSVEFRGRGSHTHGAWLDFSGLYSRVGAGVYTFRAPDGSPITAIIACTAGPCPSFRPLPVSAPGYTPSGSIAFRMSD